MKLKIIHRVYDVTDGIGKALYKEEFKTEDKALEFVSKEPTHRTFFVLKCIKGGTLAWWKK